MTKRRALLGKAGLAGAAAVGVASFPAPYVKAQGPIRWRLQTYAGPALGEHVIKPHRDPQALPRDHVRGRPALQIRVRRREEEDAGRMILPAPQRDFTVVHARSAWSPFADEMAPALGQPPP
jgi:hypothetical protein